MHLQPQPRNPKPLPGAIGLKPIVEGIRKAFPDLKYIIENMVISDSQVAVSTTMYGTHIGDLFGLAPTNKKIKVSQMQIERIDKNQIVEHSRITDDLTMLRQLGQITA